MINAHTWGCPVYVLEPRLQDGQKLPKWEPRSRQAIYVGVSPMHASTVGLVLNQRTGNISPQFHLVFDDFFQTVHSDDNVEPDVWKQLVTNKKFQSAYDQDDPPPLSNEWKTRVDDTQIVTPHVDIREPVLPKPEETDASLSSDGETENTEKVPELRRSSRQRKSTEMYEFNEKT